MPNINLSAPRDITPAADSALNAGVTERVVAGLANAGQAGYQGERDRLAAQNKEADTRRMEGYKAMLADPNNAQVVSQMYGIPFTPQLQQLLQQPQLMKNIVMASELGSKMGIKNPEAMNKLLLAAAEQGKSGQPFNPTQVFGSLDGMDLGEQMNPYQQGQLDVARGNLAVNQQNANTLSASRQMTGSAALMRAQPKTPNLWDDPSLSPALRLEGKALSQNPMADAAMFQDWQNRAYAALGQAPNGAPQAAPAAAPPANAGAGPVPGAQFVGARADGATGWKLPDGTVKYYRPKTTNPATSSAGGAAVSSGGGM